MRFTRYPVLIYILYCFLREQNDKKKIAVIQHSSEESDESDSTLPKPPQMAGTLINKIISSIRCIYNIYIYNI